MLNTPKWSPHASQASSSEATSPARRKNHTSFELAPRERGWENTRGLRSGEDNAGDEKMYAVPSYARPVGSCRSQQPRSSLRHNSRRPVRLAWQHEGRDKSARHRVRDASPPTTVARPSRHQAAFAHPPTGPNALLAVQPRTCILIAHHHGQLTDLGADRRANQASLCTLPLLLKRAVTAVSLLSKKIDFSFPLAGCLRHAPPPAPRERKYHHQHPAGRLPTRRLAER